VLISFCREEKSCFLATEATEATENTKDFFTKRKREKEKNISGEQNTTHTNNGFQTGEKIAMLMSPSTINGLANSDLPKRTQSFKKSMPEGICRIGVQQPITYAKNDEIL